MQVLGKCQKFRVEICCFLTLKGLSNKAAPPDTQRQTAKGMIEGTRQQISVHHLLIHLNFMTPDLTSPPPTALTKKHRKKNRRKEGLRFCRPWGMFVFPFCLWTVSDRAETLLTYRRFYQTSDRWVWGWGWGSLSLPAGVYMWLCVQNRSHGWHPDHPEVAVQHDSHQQTSVLEAGKEESGWGLW